MPHHPLQAGELDHHLGGQVGLAQVSGTGGCSQLCFREPQHPAQTRHQLLQPPGFVQHRAQLFLKNQGIQPRQKIFQFLAGIGPVEELGVGQTSAEHLFVAVAHGVQVLVVAVAHSDEVGE